LSNLTTDISTLGNLAMMTVTQTVTVPTSEAISITIENEKAKEHGQWTLEWNQSNALCGNFSAEITLEVTRPSPLQSVGER